MAEFQRYAAQLAAGGYAPVPIEPGTKRPLLKGWQGFVFQPTDAARFPSHGCGLLTKRVPAVDIDIRHKALAAKVQALAEKMLGKAPVRIGQAPKRAMLYRTGKPFEKLVTRGFYDEPGTKPHRVEILADGQQIVAYSTHPDTKKPYEWLNGSDPLHLPAAKLTEIDRETAVAFIRAADELIAKEPNFTPLSDESIKIESLEREQETGELKARDPAECREALRAIPNKDWGYDSYVRMMFAVKGALGAEGEGAFLEWSLKSAKHNKKLDARKEFRNCKPERIGAGTIFHLARDYGWRPRVFDAERARVQLGAPLPEPPFVVPGYLPDGTVGGLPAEGGVGKTTFALWEAVHLSLGRSLFGHEIVRPGAVVFLTAEDDRATLSYRLQRVAVDLHLDAEDIARLEQKIFIEDLTGRMLRLVHSDERGNLAVTGLGDRLIEAYKDRGVVLINIDPTNLFGPGERFVNDAEAALMIEGQRIARALGCSVRFVHHISKSAARDGKVDQYLGRGGAAFADNSRFQHHLVRHDAALAATNGECALPVLQDAAKNLALHVAVAEGRVLRLYVTKLSWAARPMEPIWLVREGHRFDVITGLARRERERAEQLRVVAFVRERLAAGVKLTQAELTDERYRELKLSRPVARRVVDELLALGELALLDLPKEERRGRRKTFVAPGLDGPIPPIPPHSADDS